MSTTFKATIEHVNHTTSRATLRTHAFLVDRGVPKGGFDLGPAGGEYMLVSLGGCFTSHLLAASRAREAVLTNVRVIVTGTLDGTPERFTAFTMDVAGRVRRRGPRSEADHGRRTRMPGRQYTPPGRSNCDYV